ncbi:MAG: HAD family hydrolase [Deltaproteobacteria bacterium]|nr:HAD family hydrolase [Deltaproteobacteria bacterium]
MSEQRYRGVLLDVDGTLVDSNDAHAHAWVEALAAFDVEVEFSRVRGLIGMGGDKLTEQLTGLAPDSPESKKLGEHRMALFLDHWIKTVRPLVGVRPLILRLRAEGYRYAIASAARSEELTPLLEIADIADLAEVRTTSSDVENSKPAPDIVEAALAQLTVEPSRTVMLGDTPYDIEAARGAGVDVIGVCTGGWSTEGLAGAVAVYASPAMLLANWHTSPLGRH